MRRMLSTNKDVKYKPLKKTASYRLKTDKKPGKTAVDEKPYYKTEFMKENKAYRDRSEYRQGYESAIDYAAARFFKDSKTLKEMKDFMTKYPEFAKGVKAGYKLAEKYRRLIGSGNPEFFEVEEQRWRALDRMANDLKTYFMPPSRKLTLDERSALFRDEEAIGVEFRKIFLNGKERAGRKEWYNYNERR